MPTVSIPAASADAPASRPLADLLQHATAAVAGVRAGRSLTAELEALPAAVRPGAQALAFHAMRHLGWADALHSRLVPRRPPPQVQALLLVALGLLAPEAAGRPPYAAHTVVDQAVRCARRVAPAQAGLVNAVLRRALREAAELAQALQADPVAHWNHPAWWIARLQQDWPDHWQAMLAANNERAPMCLRVNARRMGAEDYVQRLTAVGLPARSWGRYGVVLDQPQPVGRLPGFAQGEVSVQDLAAQLAAPLLLAGDWNAGTQPRESQPRVLDACAAPGGKTAQLLEQADLDLLALDVDAARLQRVADNLQRLGLQAELRAADAAQPDRWWDGRLFDAILLDAPCSASGILRRHPDVRWLRRAGDLPALARTQDGLLDALWPLLKPGGRLVYCTCSVFAIEGSQRADAFLQRTPAARRAAAPGHLVGVVDNSQPAAQRLQGVQSGGAQGEGITQAGPASDLDVRSDGFFYAAFDKTAAG